ncbi:sensor histidine kinase [Chitinophaga pinensis]|uniref:Signal transduction histidine kinase internal region domain-containing protein n=1 Tax=Chitinophaga pinensis TaxID=79329 RepID=A0A5C6LTN3_9BACT|nr:histidine kinase [Chitinophaga pinensis]TWV99917.1 hypothetical protein FEF09_14585 [Chitinophaga pinensis]
MMHFQINRKYRVVLLHIGAWLLYIAFGTLNKIYVTHTDALDLADVVLTQLPGIYVFYGSIYVYLKLLSARKQKYLLLLAAEMMLFITYLLLFAFIGDVIFPMMLPNVEVPPFELSSFVVAGLWTFIRYSFFAFGYYFAARLITKEKELRESELKKMQAERGKLEAEYAFLRAQINPHFLHNTLNFFYAKSLGCSRELAEGIVTLCEIMRYSLNSGEDESGMVPLSKEVEHLQNVIKINQLRFSNRLQVQFDVTGNIGYLRIIPLVLITLVENAFKHGDLNNPDHPVIFRLTVSEDGRMVHFSTHNKKKSGPKELSHGIGMDNIRKRLSAVYKDKYLLEIKDEDNTYTVSLAIHPGTEQAAALKAVSTADKAGAVDGYAGYANYNLLIDNP